MTRLGEFDETTANILLTRIPVDWAAVAQLILTEANAQAAGIWALHHIVPSNETTNDSPGVLHQLAYEATNEVSRQVQQEFREATREVPLSKTKLGIVSAVLNNIPVVAIAEPQQGGLVDSASWLVRFGSAQSLSIPITRNGKTVGVMAVSRKERFTKDSAPWQILLKLASISSRGFGIRS